MATNKDTTSKITVYRIKQQIDFTSAQMGGYTKAAEGQEPTSGYSYQLWFGDQPSYTPKWFPPFSQIASITPKAKQAGFVLLVNTQSSTYACTGGLGFHKLIECFSIEPRFGILIAKKILAAHNLKGLTQKDASGIVHNLDRVFRGAYNPQGDIDNLHRILTSLRASFTKTSAKYTTIGSSIKASDSLAVNKARDFTGILQFVKEVDDLWASSAASLSIPELENINHKHEQDLIDRLNQGLAKTIRDGAGAHGSVCNQLFLDNVDIGYLPDRVNEYTVCKDHKRQRCASHEEVFSHLAVLLAAHTGAEDTLYTELESVKVKMRFDDDTKNAYKSVLHYICGDIVLDNEAYFISNCLWFRANPDFITKINAELDEVRYLSPNDLALQSWQLGDDEDVFNKRHTGIGHILLDKHFVRVPQERGPIEFCDLLRISQSDVNAIHVKHACGAELRALFAQGYVSALLYAESKEFKAKVVSADIDMKSDLSSGDIAALAGLSLRLKREFQVVYAIYDDSSSHSADSSSPASVSKVLGKTLTLFAKIDLLGRVQAIRSMGYNVALTRIQPYP